MPPKKKVKKCIRDHLSDEGYVKPLPGLRIAGYSDDLWRFFNENDIDVSLKFTSDTKKLALFIKEMNKYSAIFLRGSDGQFSTIHSKFSSWAVNFPEISELTDPIYLALDWSLVPAGRQPVDLWQKHQLCGGPNDIGVVPNMTSFHIFAGENIANVQLGILLHQYPGVCGVVFNLILPLTPLHLNI
jgi:hypothetical protein